MTRPHPLALCFFLVGLSATGRAMEAPAPLPADAPLGQRYQRALEALQSHQVSENQSRAERDRLAAEAADLQQRLIDNAAKVQALETAYSVTEDELEKLNQTARALEGDLARNRERVAHLLAVLQRLDVDEPPALTLRPDDSLMAARSALQMGAMLPPVYAQAAALARQLRALSETRTKVEQTAAQGRQQAEALKAARVDLDRLLQTRNQETAEAEIRLGEVHGVTEEIARQTGDLKSLIDRISALREQSGGTAGMKLVTPGNVDSSALKRGALRQPVVGIAVAGDPAGPGHTPGDSGPLGVWFESSGNAQAIAPADSAVVFAGAYQKFGQVLILEIMGGYHLTLAGLGRIDVHIGDLVLAGEPVGVLPAGKMARLYMELRRNGQAVDPAPWLSAELRKAKGT